MSGVGAAGGTNGRRRVEEWHLMMASGLAGHQDCSTRLPAWSLSTCGQAERSEEEGLSGG